MQLSQKQKAFFAFLFKISKSALNFEHFRKKDDPRSWSISDMTDSEKRG